MSIHEKPTFHRADMYQGWDDSSTQITRAAFHNVLTGVVLGFIAGAATVGLLWTAVVVS